MTKTMSLGILSKIDGLIKIQIYFKNKFDKIKKILDTLYLKFSFIL